MHAGADTDLRPVIFDRVSSHDPLPERFATDLMQRINSPWIISRISVDDSVNISGLFSGTVGTGQWRDYLNAFSVCCRNSSATTIDAALRDRQVASLLTPVETDLPLRALLVVGLGNNFDRYSPADLHAVRNWCSRFGSILRFQNPSLTRAEDIRVAGEMQERLEQSCPLNINGLECAARTGKSGALGANFFDVRACGDGSIMAVLGDVAVSGFPGSILRTGLQAHFRALAARSTPLSQLLSEGNQMFWDIAPEQTHASIFCAHIDTERRLLRYVNAGDQRVLLLKSWGGVEYLQPNAAVLGLSRKSEYRERCNRFAPGTTLIALSNGLLDSLTETDLRSVESTVVRLAQRSEGIHAQELAEQILNAIETPGTPRLQGGSVLVLRYPDRNKACALASVHISDAALVEMGRNGLVPVFRESDRGQNLIGGRVGDESRYFTAASMQI
jgi:hypothetical protein